MDIGINLVIKASISAWSLGTFSQDSQLHALQEWSYDHKFANSEFHTDLVESEPISKGIASVAL